MAECNGKPSTDLDAWRLKRPEWGISSVAVYVDFVFEAPPGTKPWPKLRSRWAKNILLEPLSAAGTVFSCWIPWQATKPVLAEVVLNNVRIM